MEAIAVRGLTRRGGSSVEGVFLSLTPTVSGPSEGPVDGRA